MSKSTVQEIAAAAHVSKPLFYRHLPPLQEQAGRLRGRDRARLRGLARGDGRPGRRRDRRPTRSSATRTC
ncbi:MAG: TetR family transcriptional regulator [Deltaproteobacteria bacterium]|nr:TetR family transcriptional regulator [Deltaproteobacteria bacterium]MBW2497371.1 TetR family transcriptional regulator [Deltaproteobacteria bacterium]